MKRKSLGKLTKSNTYLFFGTHKDCGSSPKSLRNQVDLTSASF